MFLLLSLISFQIVSCEAVTNYYYYFLPQFECLGVGDNMAQAMA